MNGNLGEARRAYIEAVQISQTANDPYMTMIANTNLADVLMEQGDLHQAARIYIETLQMATRPDGRKLPLADRIYAGLSKLSYQWNHLENAAQYVQQCIELCQQWGNSNLLSGSYVMVAWLELAKGNPEKAQAAIRAAEQLVREGRLSSRQSRWVKFACAGWWITQGSLERALQLVQHIDVTIDSHTHSTQIPSQQESEFLLLLRLQLAQGDHEAALLLSECLLQMAEAGKRMGQVIEILILQALAFQGKKDVDRAVEVLGRALTLAQPERYTRIFLDEGEPMAKLLFQAKARRICSEYSSKLLSELGEASATELPTTRLLIEPLTQRELEVLKLIEAGNSNQDIADKLVISIPTVKRHLSNIYAKLGVESRTQAVSLGKELRLFD